MLMDSSWQVVGWVAVIWALILGGAIAWFVAIWVVAAIRARIQNRMYASGR